MTENRLHCAKSGLEFLFFFNLIFWVYPMTDSMQFQNTARKTRFLAMLWTVGWVLVQVASPALAQPSAADVGAKMAESQAQLRQYVWQSRVEVELDGESKKVDLYQVRYNYDGELERTRLGGETNEENQRGGTPLRRIVVKRKTEQSAEFLEAVQEQLRRYMSQKTMTTAISNAFFRTEGGDIQMRAENILIAGDTIEFLIAEETQKPTSMLISTRVDGEPVKVTVNFKTLPDGPNYPARQVLETRTANKRLVITTENYNYAK